MDDIVEMCKAYKNVTVPMQSLSADLFPRNYRRLLKLREDTVDDRIFQGSGAKSLQEDICHCPLKARKRDIAAYLF